MSEDTVTVTDTDTDADCIVNSVDELRQKGNYEFQQGNLDHAVALYSSAIELADADMAVGPLQVNLCNRSACYFQMQDYEESRDDANRAWTLSQQTNVKAAYRLAKTWIALEEYTQAIQLLQTVLTSPRVSLDDPQRSSLTALVHQATTQTQTASSDVVGVLKLKNTTITIKDVQRPVSIREFVKGKSLGVGNFSEIIVVTHRQTKETFALKILEKKQAADLAKRQHPNVYNEIAMEARVLLHRLSYPDHNHPNIIRMFHAFQDYNSLYYLMELHNVNLDLWSCLRHPNSNNNNNNNTTTSMVGTHDSMIRRWMLQLVDALEHLHSHGIVHRDLKPENILLNDRNHVVVIDFGTAKDWSVPDLNGPEFVGTPDFMSPEAVTGLSGMPNDSSTTTTTTITATPEGATHCADLWALGAVAYILYTGSCPFWSPSPYLTFLRIKRGLLPRSWGIPDDHAWDFISSLMQVQPAQRLGADGFAMERGQRTVTNKGYDDSLRSHAYFTSNSVAAQDPQSHVIPSLQDLCIRSCAALAKKDALDLENVCDHHAPGDGSKQHDFMLLSDRQRQLIWHVLDKCKVFKENDETRVLQRFFDKDVDVLRAKVRIASRDFVGLTQMNDDEYKPQSQRGSADPYAKKVDPEPTQVVVLSNPLLLLDTTTTTKEQRTPEEEKDCLKGWKRCIAHINKQRPKAVVVCAPAISPKYWKFLARIRDSIPVLWNDGSVYYSFWIHGFQGIVLQRSGFFGTPSDSSSASASPESAASASVVDDSSPQMMWLRELMEQSRMAKFPLVAFCDCDPRDLPPIVLKRLARGRVLCLYGISEQDVDFTVDYEPNETVPVDDDGNGNGNGNDNDDTMSVKSTDSVEDGDDAFTMRVIGSSQNGMQWLTVDEKQDWTTSFESVD
jgi:serine/threonine protein kinase